MNSINELQQIVASKDARIAELETLVKFYEEQFKLAKLRQFGASSEKAMPSEQLGLFNEVEAIADPAVAEPEMEQITYTRRRRIGKRNEDLSGLPVEVVKHELPEEEQVCSTCDGTLHEMGHDSRRELTIIPAQVKVTEHRRSVYSCRNCEKNNDNAVILKAAMPKPVIVGSLASPSAVAHIMTQKYVMHAPLYRQEQDWKRQGVILSRQTMANWVIRCAEDWLQPIYRAMHMLLVAHEILHADESSIQVLNEPEKSATSKSYMWLYRTSGDVKRQIILYEYQPGRSHIYPKLFLEGFRGLLHADGYAGYHKLEPELTVVGCWTHLRRYWVDALKVIAAEERPTSLAQAAIDKIAYLFHLEDGWRDLPPEERHRLRLEASLPLAEEFFDWAEKLIALPKSAIGRAINYTLGQKKWLLNMYLDGRTEISNNRIENSVRPFAVGRKNWLFANTVNGAEASAVVYSIIETAKANGLKPFEYLEFLFEVLPNSKSSDLESLLPWGEAIPERCLMPVK
jgi:transposase